MGDNSFWAATERHEVRFTGDGDVKDFRRKMLRLGHENDVIRKRVDSIHPELLGDFDKLGRNRK